MADQFSGIIDARANRTRKMVHTCDLQHACCFAHKKDWELQYLRHVNNNQSEEIE